MRLALISTFAAALVLVASGAAVGPGLPAVNGTVGAGEVSFTTTVHGQTTLLTKRVEGAVTRRLTLPGAWGVPLVTLTYQDKGGLSPNGRVLVLSGDVNPQGTLQAQSRFLVVDTRGPSITGSITLDGDYSFDALSPNGRWLYLIHHIASAENRYQVRAYDLRADKLLPGTIADRRQASWLMAGYPISRATTPGGRFVYTFYQQNDNYPFVHALDTVLRTAVCVGIPWKWWTATGAEIGAAKMTLAGHTLTITGKGAHFTLDTKTYRVGG